MTPKTNSKIINKPNQYNNTSHTTELVLGILGGIFGILGAILAIMFSAFGGDEILMLGMSALIGSIVGYNWSSISK